MKVAQPQLENMTIVSADSTFNQSGIMLVVTGRRLPVQRLEL